MPYYPDQLASVLARISARRPEPAGFPVMGPPTGRLREPPVWPTDRPLPGIPPGARQLPYGTPPSPAPFIRPQPTAPQYGTPMPRPDFSNRPTAPTPTVSPFGPRPDINALRERAAAGRPAQLPGQMNPFMNAFNPRMQDMLAQVQARQAATEARKRALLAQFANMLQQSYARPATRGGELMDRFRNARHEQRLQRPQRPSGGPPPFQERQRLGR